MIKRKPLPQSSCSKIGIGLHATQECIKEVAAPTPVVYESDPPPYTSDDEFSLLDYYLLPEGEEPSKHLELDYPSTVSPPGPQDVKADAKSEKVKHALESALSEAKHFAGGLLSRPHESTRHYTILRHSFGLIYYRGPATNVAVTILSDRPLPENRTIWLQKRGFSGKTGLAIGVALVARGAWIDVTPVARLSPNQLPKDQERSWQRDISSFLKKAQDLKHVCEQTPRETNLIRIPYAAEDGYFRVVVCSGRKVLCPSPTFRYASTSMDPGLLRGASLLSLPLELGLKVGVRLATTAANAATHHTLRPATAAVKTVSKQVDWGPVPWLGVRGGSTGLQGPPEGDGGFSVKR